MIFRKGPNLNVLVLLRAMSGRGLITPLKQPRITAFWKLMHVSLPIMYHNPKMEQFILILVNQLPVTWLPLSWIDYSGIQGMQYQNLRSSRREGSTFTCLMYLLILALLQERCSLPFLPCWHSLKGTLQVRGPRLYWT
ncbi:MAG: hypothetical protein A4E27_00038 [Methanobacterium sp. PtaU1.Bin242]|nr:MAG: hypothetical protein A4E27_00038 [Methanobacterium sp. PtaU1.Bin242]